MAVEPNDIDVTVDAGSDGTGQPRRDSHGWPAPMTRDAYYGVVGQIVDAIEPHTEADPHAVLVQTLVGLGNLLGRGARFAVEADEHTTVLYALVVGETAKGRKGTSLGYVRKLLAHADSDYNSKRVANGLSSGEGLVWTVRDEASKLLKPEDDGGEWTEEVVDPGIEDKRLLVIESEFAQALKVMARPGNTLSPALRGLWDNGVAGMLTKHDPTKATNAHVSIIGHIVRNELRRELAATEQANGFANRFLFCCAQRSKELPNGGAFELGMNLALEVSNIVQKAALICKGAPLVRDDQAQALWVQEYSRLSAGAPGMLGAVTGRAEALVTRLSLLYAILDESHRIRVGHLAAALEVWRYCEDSAKYIFGDATGDPVADEILTALLSAGAKGMSRTEVRDLFSRHRTDRVGSALTALTLAGLASYEKVETGGRPAERWFSTKFRRGGVAT
jgi:hypothetical protein